MSQGRHQHPLIHSPLKYWCGCALSRAFFAIPTPTDNEHQIFVYILMTNEDGLRIMVQRNERQARELRMVRKRRDRMKKWQLI